MAREERKEQRNQGWKPDISESIQFYVFYLLNIFNN